MALDIRWREVDQMIYPGQQEVIVGWSTSEGAPQLRVYRSSGHKQFTSHESGELVVDKVGDWSPAAEDQADLADVLCGLGLLFLDLCKLHEAEKGEEFHRLRQLEEAEFCGECGTRLQPHPVGGDMVCPMRGL